MTKLRVRHVATCIRTCPSLQAKHCPTRSRRAGVGGRSLPVAGSPVDSRHMNKAPSLEVRSRQIAIGAGGLAVNGLLLRPRAAPRTGAQAHGSRRDRTRFGPEPRKIGNDRRARPA